MSKEQNSEVKHLEKGLRAKCKLMMLIDVITARETKPFFCDGWIEGVQEAQNREMS